MKDQSYEMLKSPLEIYREGLLNPMRMFISVVVM